MCIHKNTWITILATSVGGRWCVMTTFKNRVNVNASHPYTTIPLRHMGMTRENRIKKRGRYYQRITARKIGMAWKDKCLMDGRSGFQKAISVCLNLKCTGWALSCPFSPFMCPHLVSVWKWLFVHHMQTMTHLVQTTCNKLNAICLNKWKVTFLSPNILNLQPVKGLAVTGQVFYLFIYPPPPPQNCNYKSLLIRSALKEMEARVHFLTSTILTVKCRHDCEVVALKS